MKPEDDIVLSLQPVGIALLWGSPALIGLGLFLFAGPLILLGCVGLFLILLCRWLARIQLTGLKISRQLPSRVFSGERFTIEAGIRNETRWLHSSDLTIVDSMAESTGRSVHLSGFDRGSARELRWSARLFRRGVNSLNQFSIVSRWPLGIFEARLTGQFQSDSDQAEEESVLVVPRPLTTEILAQTLDRMEMEAAHPFLWQTGSPAEFRHLREFRSGDAVKSIHWPGSTRAGRLLIRENDPPCPSARQFGLLIHTFSPAGEIIRNDRLEIALRMASGLIVFFRDRRVPFLFSATFDDHQAVQRVPSQAGYAAVFDRIARALPQFSSHLDSALSGLEWMKPCDRIFVIGTAPLSLWESAVEKRLPGCVCLDAGNPILTRQPHPRNPMLNRKGLGR